MASLPQHSTAEWQELDRRHYLHPFTDYRDLGARGSRIITRAEGVYIWDSEGNRILDGMSGLWCMGLGYGRKDLVEAARRQMDELPYYNSFFQCAHPPAIELAARIAGRSPPQFGHVFFTGGGSEANDTVIRMVRQYWALQGQPDRQVIISRRNAYHGSTIGAASLSGMSAAHAQGGLPIPGIKHIGQPYWFELGGELSPDEFGRQAAAELETRILELGVERVAAFIGEPIQGAGGAIIPPDSYWPAIQRICDQYGILLVADEVITGFGRLGEWFGSEFYGITPDLAPFAKGITAGYLPLGGVLVGDRVANMLIDHGGEFFHGFTYSGHPAACAVALATLDALESEAIVERVRDEIGPYFADRWRSLGEHPLVAETRSAGLIAALELAADKASRRRLPKAAQAGLHCRNIAVEQGLVMRAVGDTMICAPPLVISREQVDELVDKAWRILDLTSAAITAVGT